MNIVPMQVTLLDHMGTDLNVVNAARVSFSKESTFVYPDDNLTKDRFLSEADTKLINYLAKHNHWTPFGHAFVSFRIKAPIFVARQLVKHQVGLVWNEESRRYIDSEPEFFMPLDWRARPDGSIKQGSGDIHSHSDTWNWTVGEHVNRTLSTYKALVADGIAPEQARMVLPLNTMTEWIWSGSLAAFARVCKLRLDPHAQKETAEVARHINAHMNTLFPVSWKALTE